jgi:hypothetical protein
VKRLLKTILTVGSSRALSPLVIGFFFLFYVGIAFFTDEALITLMALTGKSKILVCLLALIPLNYALRIVQETIGYLKIRRIMSGKSALAMPELFDETVELPAFAAFSELERRLAAVGYKTRRKENSVAAWQGIGGFPVRLLFLAGTFCLFTGILISITSRTAERKMVIEGEMLPTPNGTGGQVERITLANAAPRSLLSRTLTMEVAPSDAGQGSRKFGIYPPALYGGSFVYPRYLGLAAVLQFSAPGMPSPYERHGVLNCYPPGKEDAVLIPDSPYRIVFSIPEPAAGTDRYISYVTGKVTFQFKLLKGSEVVFSGTIPGGGEYVHDGYRLALPDVRRLVVTDFIGDYGVLFIWATFLLFIAAGCLWLPIRLLWPRREMWFVCVSGVTTACSRAEGGARRHAGVFHEALDLIDARKAASEAH